MASRTGPLVPAASGREERNASRSWQQSAKIDRRLFAFGLTLVLVANRLAGNAPEIVAGIFAGAADQQILLLVDEAGTLVLAHLEIGDELDRVGRTRLFAPAAKDAA